MDSIVPILIVLLLGYGLVKKCDIFDIFIKGAKDGLQIGETLLPAMIALLTAIGMFQASGGLDLLSYLFRPVADFLSLPPEVIPLTLIRPISGSGALAIFENLIATYGPDEYIGLISSVMQGATETTFYTMAIYFSVTGVKKGRYASLACLSADIMGFFVSGIAVRWLFFR